MARKKKHEEHENLERWMVSYADFLTLLFATFVALYALSQIDLAKAKLLQKSIRQAFSKPSTVLQGDSGILDKSGESILESGSRPTDEINLVTPMMEVAEAQQEDTVFNETKQYMDDLAKNKVTSGVQTKVTDRGLEITLVDSLLFNSGSAEIRKNAYASLGKVGKLIKDNFEDHSIRIEGHTDNVPIKSTMYPSNWELSSCRASNIVRFFISHFHVTANRFAAIGYADNRPIASNSTEAGRLKNRRVEIIILRNKLLKTESHITGINKIRLEKIKNYSVNAAIHIKTDPIRVATNQNQLSEAAKKLLKSSKNSINNVLLYGDNYDKESEKIYNELQKKEMSIKNKPLIDLFGKTHQE